MPVIRDCDSDSAVTGVVVSSRYNSSTGGWRERDGWPAPPEDLTALLSGITGVKMRQARQESKVVVYGYTQQFT